MKSHDFTSAKMLTKEGQAFRQLMKEHGLPTLNRINIHSSGIELAIVIAPFFRPQFIDNPKLCDYLSRLLQRRVTVWGYSTVRSFWRAPRSVLLIWIESPSLVSQRVNQE